MAKAQAGMKLVRWLANQGDDVVSSAEDLARFGPQAAQVRSLLDFLPTMSDEAIATTNRATTAGITNDYDAIDIWDLVDELAKKTNRRVWDVEQEANKRWRYKLPTDAVLGEMLGDVLPAKGYAELTDPLAAGRAVDLLRNRSRFQNTPFLDVVRQAGERGAVRGPRDVVAAGRIARSPEDIREIAMTLMADGMSAEEAMRTARML